MTADYSAEMQRRLRAVLTARSGKPVPGDAEVIVDEDAVVTGEDHAETRVTLHLADFAIYHDDDDPGCVARLIRDLDAVPDAGGTA